MGFQLLWPEPWPLNSYVEAPALVRPSGETQDEMGSLGGDRVVLIQGDQGLYKKGTSGHRPAWRDDPVRTQGEHGCPHTRREASGGPALPAPGPPHSALHFQPREPRDLKRSESGLLLLVA